VSCAQGLTTIEAIVRSDSSRPSAVSEPQVRETMGYFEQLTVALVGIGSLHPSRLLGESGNVFSKDEMAELEKLGAVGDLCVRFFDKTGHGVTNPFNNRVIGMSLDQLCHVPRAVGIAGGPGKLKAIRGALEGRLIGALITDRFTAEHLVS
jgi:DNA-binding transcriptional regulator LsrR (DeoR family)